MRRLDLPLEQTAAGRLLPWIVAALTYLAVVALAIAAVADGALRLHGLRASLVTVTLPSIVDNPAGEREVAAALDILRRARGVTSATPVPPQELEKLIQPWVGEGQATVDLPIPRLIDVTLDPHAKPDLPALQEELRAVVAGATIGGEAIAHDRTESLAGVLRAWGGGLGMAVLAGLLVAVAWLTRLSVAAQAKPVEILRCLGASDAYVARQFERHALLSGSRGAVLGFGLAVLSVLAGLGSGEPLQPTDALPISLRPVDWILLACVPVVAILLLTAITRLTALWGLARTA